jgi:hypothetical protein
MRIATTTIITLFLGSAQAFTTAPSPRNMAFAPVATSTRLLSSPLDGLNREMVNDKDDDDAPMTKAEMRAAEKEMKAEMKRLKDEAAAAAKEE